MKNDPPILMIQNTVKTTNNLNHLVSLSKKCKTLKQLNQIHAQIILNSPNPRNPLSLSPILSAAAEASKSPSFFAYARAIFDNLDRRNVFAYNTMIRAFARSRSPIGAVSCYSEMLSCGVKANNFTFPGLIKSCTVLGPRSGPIGRLIHAHVVELGFGKDPFVNSALIEFYSAILSDTRSARKLFDECPERDVVLWTAMIDGYGKTGEVERAREVFDEMPERNSVSWSAIMAAYSRSNDFGEVMSLFEQMQGSGTKPNESVLVTVLTACANLGAVTQGLWVHSYAKKKNLESNPILATALVDMYSKCGLIDSALLVFEKIRNKDVEAWNAMITGLSINGCAAKSLELFNQMVKTDRVRPTGTTFVAILTACTHAKMLDEGLEIFDKMESFYGIEARPEHYACVVDLLGRSGMVEEAERFVDEKMGGLVGPDPDPNVWGALLGACRVHGNVEIGDRVWKKLVEKGASDLGAHVLSYNMYRESGREAEANRVRERMSRSGISKPPGFSAVEVNGTVEEFFAGDYLCHRKSLEIVKTLESFSRTVNSDDFFY